MNRLAVAIATLALAIALCACERAADAPHGAQPASPPAHASPLRIAMLSPAGAVMLRDLGLGDAIVARHAFDAASLQTLPSVGDQAGIDYEALLSAAPTHVITQWGARELPERLVQLAQTSGTTLHDMNPVSLHDVRKDLAALQALVGTPGSAAKAASLDAQLASMIERADAPRASNAKRVVLLLSASPIAVLGPTSCQAQAARAAGFVVVPQEGPAYAELSGEEFVALGVQAIVLFAPGVDAGDGSQPAAANADTKATFAERAKSSLRAAGFTSERVPMLVVRDVESLLPSTSMVRVHTALAAWNAGE
jgi:ABC-type hemin transport system substrate-binding protein